MDLKTYRVTFYVNGKRCVTIVEAIDKRDAEAHSAAENPEGSRFLASRIA